MTEEIIILLDTGIDKMAFKNSIIGGKHFYAEGDSIYCDDNFQDDNGHGSACAYVIKSVFPSAQFYVIKTLDKKAKTIYPVLEVALEYCLTLNYKIINLSLAMLDEDIYGGFDKLCDRLQKEGKILLSSVYNGYHKSYPASYPSVIGVRGSRFISPDNYWYNSCDCIQCIADNTPCFTNRMLDDYFMFGGNSKACALMSGMILKKVNINHDILSFENVNLLLEKGALKNMWDIQEIDTSYSIFQSGVSSLCDEKILESIRQILYDTIDKKIEMNIGWQDNLYEIGIMKPCVIKKIIINLENCFGINIPDSYINFNSLSSINMIGKIIEGAKNEKN